MHRHTTRPARRRPAFLLRPLPRAVALAWLLASAGGLQAAGPAPTTLPTGPKVLAGQASITTQGVQMTVQNTPGAVLDWRSFSIGAAAGVHFQQASAASKVLNRVSGTDPSQIFGSLTSNGQVWLANPHGVLFGASARVDVAGLVASTLRLNDNDFLAQRYQFSLDDSLPAAAVRNEGSIRSGWGGQVVLLGETVANTGEISTPGGHLHLAAGRSVELLDTGLPHLAVRVHAPAGEVLNLGRLAADGGTVDVFGAIVNQQGLVQADTLRPDARGHIVLRAADTLMLGDGSTTRASGAGAGGVGGHIDLLGAQVGLTGSAAVDASGSAGGGQVRLGGGLMGRDASVPNALAVYIGPEARVSADANGDAGTGGRITVWSDTATRAYGHFSAHGGALRGDGGFIETSGGWLDARPASVDVGSRGGRAGTWLLDPNDIFIVSSGSDSNISGGPVFTSTDDSSVITTATLAAALNAGNSVTVLTSNSGSNTQAGDIVMDAATLAVAPPADVTLTLSAARDVIVHNSSIETSAAPLNLVLQSAYAGAGVIEIYNSSINTRGGNITLEGALSQLLPLPGGVFTPDLYNPAIAHGAGGFSLSGGEVAVNVEASTLDLGAGRFRATGLTTFDNRDGLRIGSSSGAPTSISAGHIDLVGVSFVSERVNIDVGVMIQGENTNLTATQSFTVDGAGTEGISIEAGARLALNAAVGSGAAFTLRGVGEGSHGVVIFADDIDTGLAGRGTRITVNNASLDITANSYGDAGFVILNNAGAPGPVLDLAGATAATFLVERSVFAGGFSNAAYWLDVDVVLPTGGATTFTGDLGFFLRNTFLTGDGGSLAITAQGVGLDNALIASTGGPLSVTLATAGANPLGVTLVNTIVTTNGGDVQFGVPQTVSSPALGSSGAAAPWVEGVDQLPQTIAALFINGSVIDAGAGRIVGGGAAYGTGSDLGTMLWNSNLTAREIRLAGRSDELTGLLVESSQLFAGQQLVLDGLSAGIGPGLEVRAGAVSGSLLQLDDVDATPGAQMLLTGRHTGSGIGARLEGGDVGTAQESRLVVSGAALTVEGTGNGDGIGLLLTGSINAPGGLLINALGATGVTLEGNVASGVGTGLLMQYSNLLGPQGAADAVLELLGNGAQASGTPGTRVISSSINTLGSLYLRGAHGLLVEDSLVTAEAGLVLQSNGSEAGPISIRNSRLATAAAGAELIIRGLASGPDGLPAIGNPLYASGTGVSLSDSELLSPGAGASLLVQGQGAASGGSGLTFTRTPMTAENITLQGTGVVLGDGVFAEDLTGGMASVLTATNLTIRGTAADNLDNSKVGVRLGANVQLAFVGQGTGLIEGDYVLLGDTVNGKTPQFLAGGDAASFSVHSTRSLALRFASLDFSLGAGTDVYLHADTDADGDWGGRARVQSGTVLTGGGRLSVRGEGVRGTDPDGTPRILNVTVLEAGAGVVILGATMDAGSGTVEIDGTASPLGGAGIFSTGGSVLGQSVVLSGRSSFSGNGVLVGDSGTPATLNITADQVTITGAAAGIDSLTGLPYAGISANGGSVWSVTNGGALALTTTGGAVRLAGTTLNAGSLAVDSATGISLTDVTAQTASGALLHTNRVAEGGVALLRSNLTASEAAASIRIERFDGNGAIGSAAENSGVGVTLTDSLLSASQPGSVLVVSGEGAPSGGSGLVFTRTPMTAPSLTLRGRGAVLGSGVVGEDLSNGVASVISATDLTVTGISVDPGTPNDPNDPNAGLTFTEVGVRLGSNVRLELSGRGTALISGDTVLLGNDSAGLVAFRATGDAASLTVTSDGTQRIVRSTLDFSGGAGTDVSLLADHDGDQSGRARLDNTTVRTGGGDFTASGVGQAGSGPGFVNHTTLRIGASGLLFSGAVSVDAGTGSISLTGSAPFDPANQDNPNLGGGWGINNNGTANLTAAAVTLTGTGGTRGVGIELGNATTPSVLNITTDSLTVDGSGAGSNPAFPGQAYLGVSTFGASTWTVNNGGSLTLRGASSVSVTGLTATASGDITVDGRGGEGLPGVSVTDSRFSGASVAFDGIGNGGQPGLLFSSSAAHSISATSGDLRLRGREPLGLGAGIDATGAWTWSTPGRLEIESENALRLGAVPHGSGPSVVFADASEVGVTLVTTAPATMGVRGAQDFSLDSAELSTAMAGLVDTSVLVLRVKGESGIGLGDATRVSGLAADGAVAETTLAISGALTVPGRLEVVVDNLSLLPGAALSAAGSGDAIVLRGNVADALLSFSNTADPAPLTTPNGRWLLLAQDPRQTALGNLAPDFSAYGLAGEPWALDAQGNYITPANGDAVGFALAPADVLGLALGGLLSKVYDAGTAITLDPLSWSLTGLLPGDVLTLAGVDIATLADKNVGIGKAVTLDAGTVFSVVGPDGQPVFGYSVPVFTANVSAAPMAVTGTVVANKVYDASLAAALSAPGGVSALGADSVALAGGSASFADKNVGVAKPVVVSGLTLVGADAGNYTLVPPTGLVADITPRPLSVSGLTAQNKVYDTTLAAPLAGTAAVLPLGADDVLLAGTASGAFADKNAGLVKPVAVAGLLLTGTDAGNYTLVPPTGLVADITPAPLPVAGLAAVNRVYDGGTAVALAGTAGVTPLAGDSVAVAGAAAGSVADKGVGNARPVAVGGLSFTGPDAANYTLQPPALVVDISPATLALAGVAAADKVYDGGTTATVNATLGGAVAGDALTLLLAGSFADANAGSGKTVAYSASLAGADAANYVLDASASGNLLANISPAVLTYLATPVAGTVGQLLPPLSGSVTGFVAGETLATATTGTLAWSTPATPDSLPGHYAINGSGLAALNYSFVQAPGNAQALILRSPAANDPASAATSVVVGSALAAVQLPVGMSSPTDGRVLDVTLALDAALGNDGAGGLTFEALDWSQLPRDEVQSLLAARARHKQTMFQNGVYRLQQDPSLADIANCRSEAELDTGLCLITEQLKQQIQAARAQAAAERERVAQAQAQQALAQAQAQAARAAPAARPLRDGQRRVRQAVLPNIERKLALLIGVNRYQDRRIPQLKGALPDALAVNRLLEDRLGYETMVLENPSREAVVRAFNRLALQADANDSVIVYYAGHGVLEPLNGVDTGFWLPSDSQVDQPNTWLANDDIARLVGAVSARQIMLVSDSCYAGSLVGRDRAQIGGGVDADELLKRKAAVVMASGGEEPVSDRGKNGHSAFAWHFMQALQEVDRWQVGSSLFDRVRAAVVKELPQTPQYGASARAGHQGNTDYLFERREIEKLTR